MIQNDTKKVPKSSTFFNCSICYYSTSRKSQYDRHITTDKHKNALNGTKMVQNGTNLVPKSSNNYYHCSCGNVYKYTSGYYRHKKLCNNINKEELKEDDITEYKSFNHDDLKSIVLDIVKNHSELQKQNVELQKQNVELQKQMLEVCKNTQITYINNSTMSNCNNKTFNLQVFLNETCKDAMNLSEFIENISLQLSDLESIGRLGYVEGVSNIIIKNLNALEVEKRPMHCTDKKREIMYVKDDDEWQKEQDDKKRIKSVISNIISKNLELLPEYEDKYPECMNPESKKSDEYNKIIMETMGGAVNNNGEKNKEKIIRKIAKEVVIDKE
jgi:hypothetical protein